MTVDELLHSGRATVSVEVAGSVLGIGRTLAYSLARRGDLPGVIRLGHRYVVAVPRLLQALGIADEPGASIGAMRPRARLSHRALDAPRKAVRDAEFIVRANTDT